MALTGFRRNNVQPVNYRFHQEKITRQQKEQDYSKNGERRVRVRRDTERDNRKEVHPASWGCSPAMEDRTYQKLRAKIQISLCREKKNAGNVSKTVSQQH